MTYKIVKQKVEILSSIDIHLTYQLITNMLINRK